MYVCKHEEYPFVNKYEEYLSKEVCNHLPRDEWLNEMYILQSHIELWKRAEKEDLLMNCDVLPNYSNEPFVMIDKRKHSYFIRKDYLQVILKEFARNIINVLPMNDMFETFKERGLEPVNQLSMIISDGLGNRLFQLAMAYGTCKRHNIKFDLIVLGNKHSKNQYNHIFSHFNSLKLLDKSLPIVQENCNYIFDYDESIINCIKSNERCIVKGFYQSSQYFKEYREDILEFCKIPNDIELYINKKYPKIYNCLFIHVRLTDYLGQYDKSIHFIDLNDYYKDCLSKIDSNETIYLFSDDTLINVTKYYPFFKEYKNIELINEKNELVAFYMMSKCGKGGICANSTFSWWTSYLNDNPFKVVYKPDKFINGYNGKFNM
jgi:hypothetical protein